jgi:hypothetical protein
MITNYINTNNNIYRQIIDTKTNKKTNNNHHRLVKEKTYLGKR